MSPKVPEAYPLARRAEILEADLECFMGKGFLNTTMKDIYRFTNLSPGAIYNCFSSKEDIVVLAMFSKPLMDLENQLPEENPAEPAI